MQRWIVIAVIALVLATAGGGYALFNYRANKPERIWVPLKLPEADLKPVSKKLDEALRKPALLSSIVKDLGLVSRFNVPTEEAAVAELSKRLFVEVGEANPPSDRTPALNVGVAGKRKERALLNEISSRVMKDVMALFGVSQPPAPVF
ncbi:MAG: hypothetical protein QM755_14195 [Luteolibacter sp.]